METVSISGPSFLMLTRSHLDVLCYYRVGGTCFEDELLIDTMRCMGVPSVLDRAVEVEVSIDRATNCAACVVI